MAGRSRKPHARLCGRDRRAHGTPSPSLADRAVASSHTRSWVQALSARAGAHLKVLAICAHIIEALVEVRAHLELSAARGDCVERWQVEWRQRDWGMMLAFRRCAWFFGRARPASRPRSLTYCAIAARQTVCRGLSSARRWICKAWRRMRRYSGNTSMRSRILPGL